MRAQSMRLMRWLTAALLALAMALLGTGQAFAQGANPAALAFVSEVVEQAKAAGLVQQWVARAGVQGVQVPPPARAVRLPATGAPAVAPASSAATAALMLLGSGLAGVLGASRRMPRRRRAFLRGPRRCQPRTGRLGGSAQPPPRPQAHTM